MIKLQTFRIFVEIITPIISCQEKSKTKKRKRNNQSLPEALSQLCDSAQSSTLQHGFVRNSRSPKEKMLQFHKAMSFDSIINFQRPKQTQADKESRLSI